MRARWPEPWKRNHDSAVNVRRTPAGTRRSNRNSLSESTAHAKSDGRAPPGGVPEPPDKMGATRRHGLRQATRSGSRTRAGGRVMSGYDSFPPPGSPPPGPPPGHRRRPPPPGRTPPAATPPGPPAPRTAPPGHPGQPGPPYAGAFFHGAAHKPGALPLRPLTLGDIYDGALKVIRFNPKATVGSAVLVTAIAMAVPVLLTACAHLRDGPLARPGGHRLLHQRGGRPGDVVRVARCSASCSRASGWSWSPAWSPTSWPRPRSGSGSSLGEAWARTRGKRWRLIGLTVLVGLVSVLLMGLYALAWVPVVLTGDGPVDRGVRRRHRPAVPGRDVAVLDPRLLPAGAGPDARAGRRDRRDRARLPADQPGVLADLRHRHAHRR